MIPPCNEDGYLPPGIHGASLEEIAARFGRESELRQVQMESLRWLVDAARRAGALRIIVNGSFVTDKVEPNDVDCVLLIGPGFPSDPVAEAELLAGVPFINLELVDLEGFASLLRELLPVTWIWFRKACWRSSHEHRKPAPIREHPHETP